MSEHTKEPWSIFGKDMHIMGIQYDEAVKLGVNHAQWTHNCSDADARRIVACVNACEGIPTYQLLGENEAPVNLGDMIDILRNQRDELLAALKSIVKVADGPAYGIASKAIEKYEKQLAQNADFV